MHNKKIRNLLKKPQPNSGFTLTELLTGLIMSIFVTGALGFGLYQIMSATGAERAKANARTEASRAVEFISDELRRAQSIEPNANKATGFNSSGKTVVLALNVTGQNSRIVYYLKDKSNSDNWQGPQILYRWGPPLNEKGEYTTGTWQEEALIDGIDDTPITATSNLCDNNYSLTTSNPSGFYACIKDETPSTAAEIFLTGGIDANVIAGNDSNYTANTKAVARAKEVTVNAAQAAAVSPISFRSLEADYVCNTGSSQTDTTDDVIWTMRTDFDNSPYGKPGETVVDSASDHTKRTATNMNKATKWIHEPDRQAQPIDIDSNNDLTIYSLPVESTNCDNPNTGNNEGLSKTKNLSEFITDTPARHRVPHTIKFQPEVNGRANDTTYYKTFNGNTASGYDNPNVTSDGRVQVFKAGSTIDEALTTIPENNNASAVGYPGYDPDGPGENSAPYRQSLGEFLQSKGYATCISNCNANYNSETPRKYQITDKLKSDERIIAFEVGHTDRTKPGFDLQDNIFVMRHDAFKETHPKTSSNTENNSGTDNNQNNEAE